MKKKKQNYSQLHYEQELAAQKRRSKKHPEPVPEIIPGKEDPQTGILFFLRRILFPNLTDLLLNNLLFFLTVLPLLLLTELTLHTGGLIFLAGAWLFSPIAAAGMAALYHRCCEYTRRIAPSVRIAFVSFFIHNLKASILPGLISGFLWILCGIYNRRKQAKIHFHIALLLTDSANFIFSQLLHHHALTSGCFIPASRQSCLKKCCSSDSLLWLQMYHSCIASTGFYIDSVIQSLAWPAFLFPGYSGNYLNNHHSSSLAKAAADSFERRIIPSSKKRSLFLL